MSTIILLAILSGTLAMISYCIGYAVGRAPRMGYSQRIITPEEFKKLWNEGLEDMKMK